jgi:hypothetical protein
MTFRTRNTAVATAAAVITLFGSAATQATAAIAPANTATSVAQRGTVAPPVDALTAPVKGLLGGKPFTGMLNIESVTLVNGVPTLVGTLTGEGLPAAGVPFQKAITAEEIAATPGAPIPGAPIPGMSGLRAAPGDPVPGAPAPAPEAPDPAPGFLGPVCDVLTLNLGPLDLDALGLVADLEPVDLELDGQTGQGKLLGNLLCGVAGALNNTPGAPGLLPGILPGILPGAPAPAAPAPAAPAPAAPALPLLPALGPVLAPVTQPLAPLTQPLAPLLNPLLPGLIPPPSAAAQ